MFSQEPKRSRHRADSISPSHLETHICQFSAFSNPPFVGCHEECPKNRITRLAYSKFLLFELRSAATARTLWVQFWFSRSSSELKGIQGCVLEIKAQSNGL